MTELTIENPVAQPIPSPVSDTPIAEPGQIDQSWLDQFKDVPDDIKKDPSLKPFKDVGSLLKSYVNAQKMIGKDRAILPTEKSPPEDWANFYKKMGLPEKEKYDLKTPEWVKPDATLEAIKEMAHQNGILPRQLQPVLDSYYAKTKEAQELAQAEAKKQREEQLGGLKKEWGNAYEKNISLAKEALKAFGDENLVGWLNESGAGDNIHIIKLLNNIGSKLIEQPMKAMGAEHDGSMSPQEKQARIGDIMADPAYWDGSSPKHKPLVDELTRLMAK
jgi:hypothetical protein